MFLSNAMSWSRLSWYQTPRTSTTPSMTTRRNLDRKSTRLNSSHRVISYAVFCLKKKNGADGISDIEGKPARVRDEGDGKRPSFKSVAKTLQGSSRRLAAVTNRPAACAPQSEYVDRRIKRCLIACQQLREASNEGTLRAFRNADRFTTFNIFRGPRAVRRRVAPGQSRRSDRIGWPQWSRQINLVCAPPR